MRALILLVAMLALAPLGTSQAAVITTLNFDSVVLAPGASTNGAAYLASFGITFVPGSPGASTLIYNVLTQPQIFSPSSPPNVFSVVPPVANNNVSGDLVFSTPLTSLSFTRAAFAPGVGQPRWDAFFYDASNNLLSSVGEGFLTGPPGQFVQAFTINVPGITRLHFDAYNSIGTTIDFPALDDFRLSSSVPEPGTLALLGLGLSVIALPRGATRPQHPRYQPNE